MTKLAYASTPIALGFLLALLFAHAACAETWYLMAADPKVIGQPKAANIMMKGSMAGPIRFTSQETSPSRNQCESRRTKLLHSWRDLNLTMRGGWDRYGVNTPNVFTQCVASTDPRLSGSKLPTMNILVPVKPRRIR